MNSLNTTLAVHQLCADYHSGQTSRGYRILTAIQRRLRRHGYNTRYLTPDQSAPSVRRIYNKLVTKYADKI